MVRDLAARSSLAALLVCSVGTHARADTMPADSHGRVYRYSVANLVDFPDHLLVAYPVVCDWMTGESYARDVSKRIRDMAMLLDYDVILPGRTREPPRHCKETRLYVVEATGWSMTDVDSAPGRGTDEAPIVKVDELERLEVDGRAKFFAAKGGDPRVHPTGHALEPWTIVPDSDPIEQIEEVFRLERRGDRFTIRGERVTYVYADASREVLPYTGRTRPAASGKGTQPPPPPPAPPPDPPAPPPTTPPDTPTPPPATPQAPAPAATAIVSTTSSAPAWPRWPWLVGGCGLVVILTASRLRRR